MNPDWTILVKLSAAFLLLFAVAELLYHILHIKAEYTRKLVHTGTGLLTLWFPVYLQHLWQVVAICAAFLAILMASRKFHFLQSVNAVHRTTAGSILYPVIVLIVFWFYQYMQAPSLPVHPYLYFYLPVLIMAVADPIAAITGTAYQQKHPLSQGKTSTGSAAFFISAFAVSCVLFLLFDKPASFGFLLLYSFVIAGCTTITERYSSKGWDNFTIPVVAMLLLYCKAILLPHE